MKVLTSRIEKIVKPKAAKKASQKDPTSGQGINRAAYYDRVERKAYELYEKRGCQDGNDLGDWFEAENIVEQEMILEK